jgi:hypothetical protein
VLDCKASLKCFEIKTSSFQQIGQSPEQIKSKRFKKFHNFFKLLAKALKTVLHCKAPLIAAQCNKTTLSVGLLR